MIGYVCVLIRCVSALDDVNVRVSALRLLVSLLPPVNRDTLWYLLTFLSHVARHADDQLDMHNRLTVSHSLVALAPGALHDRTTTTTTTTTVSFPV